MEKATDLRPRTIFVDIDGTLLYQSGGLDVQMRANFERTLPGVLEKFHEWDCLGYKIILVTGRRKSMRRRTEEQLEKLGIYYDDLVMDCGGGIRVMINNSKESQPGVETAIGITVPKNRGLEDLPI